MADDLDWNAIIAPGSDAERRDRTETRRGEDPTDTPTDGPPLSRREARAARTRAEAAARPDDTPTDGDAPSDRAVSDGAASDGTASDDAPRDDVRRDDAGRPAPRPVVRAAPTDGDVHPDVHALLGGSLHSGPVPGARGEDASAGAAADAAASADATDARPADGPLDDGLSDDGLTGDGLSDDGLTGGGRGAGGRGGDDGGRRGGRGGASRPPRDERPPRRKGPLIAGIVIVAIVVAGGAVAYNFAAPKIQAIASAISGSQESDDYTGDGTSKVTITIKDGDIGEDVAATLQRSGVVKTSKVFYQLLLASPNVQFQPGSYALKKKMSSKAALTALQDKANRVQDPSIVIPEGTALTDIEAGMVSKAGLSKADVEAAAKDLSAYGLPSGVTTLEGWLFPATYPINPKWTAEQYFKTMVDTMKQHLKSAGVAEADQERVVVFASLVQKEAGLAADYPKVARVFQNRLDDGMLLQSDATVAYGTGNTHRVTTTDAERADASNRYNTYQHEGLPPAPISNPGDLAINAVTKMATGNWRYFVTVNLETGETVFSDTLAQHEQAVKQFQAWLRAHPDYQ
ncbi:UPF0755 protein [Curtobacterium herbarum]|uniref:endolytic transglycosylase MltG n=1 Tax=Curtobacterium herbarum TaxID=150122 RepID=UPI00209D4DAC|nr:endolytic transglycosylase MltG [Curtobacterium herbarum]MCP1502152.1 UPF0755 protein [Curtobacterium herbarum]